MSIFKNIQNKFTKYLLTFIFIFVGFCSITLGLNITVNAQTAQGATKGIEFLQPTNLKCIIFQEPTKEIPSPKNPPGCKAETSLVQILLNFLYAIAPFVTTILIIFGGYEYFVDNEAKKTSAKSTIFAAVSGYIIIILAPVITKVITKTFNGTDSSKVINTAALEELFTQIINVLIDLSSLVAVVVIVLGGYAYFLQFFVNSGKQEGKMNGRELLIAGIMGLIVTTIARPLVGFIKSTLTAKGGDLGINDQNIIGFIRNVLANFLIPFASVVTLIFIVASAFMWLTAGSDETKVKNARTTLNGALIGLVIVLLSTTIVQLIIYFIQPATGFIPGTNSSVNNNVTSNPDPLKTPAAPNPFQAPTTPINP
jgi:Type IV secretion system pilin